MMKKLEIHRFKNY